MSYRPSTSRNSRSVAATIARTTRSIDAARAYLQCLWDKARAEQNAVVFKLRVEYIERKLKEFANNSNAPALPANEAAALKAWLTQIKPAMKRWEDRVEVKMLEGMEVERLAEYKKYREALGLGVYDAPIFVIHPLESEERLAIQKRFDVEREVLIMTNPETVLSQQDIVNLRTGNGNGRVLYRGCPLMTPAVSVQNEIDALQAAGDVVNELRNWVPAIVAKHAGTDLSGDTDEEDLWGAYFASMGYERIENSAAMSASTPVPARGQQGMRPPQPPPAAPARGTPSARAPTAAPAPAYQHPFGPFGGQAPPPPPPPAAPPAAAPPAPNALFSRHGRPQPYRPTRQPTLKLGNTPTKWNAVRGNTPGNVNVFVYDKLYNTADSGVGKDNGDKRKRYRESGETRDLTIDKLIARGDLPQGFQDTNP
ncbi:hypothetical protein BKA65DRAFT_579305 [Rhexocercosporidium sp. MPI-PUGE-AT-0058]|nr:hypothetical protein BKA65DRAFT_579305 [Rhexocercosporidium sp. MPI-PUGE-AT-0058]